MLKGANKNLAFLTGVLGEEREGRPGEQRDWSDEGRRRAAEKGLRKLKGERAVADCFCDLLTLQITYGTYYCS